MSKTLIGILETAAGVALEFGPGTQALGTSLIVAGIATTATALFTGTPKPEATASSIKKPIPERVSAYGLHRVAGGYIL